MLYRGIIDLPYGIASKFLDVISFIFNQAFFSTCGIRKSTGLIRGKEASKFADTLYNMGKHEALK